MEAHSGESSPGTVLLQKEMVDRSPALEFGMTAPRAEAGFI